MWQSFVIMRALSCSLVLSPAGAGPADSPRRNHRRQRQKAFRADVAIQGGVIVQLGSLRSLKAKEVIDATGLVRARLLPILIQYPDGIPIVIVNGVPVLRDGKCTGARPGQILALSAGR